MLCGWNPRIPIVGLQGARQRPFRALVSRPRNTRRIKGHHASVLQRLQSLLLLAELLTCEVVSDGSKMVMRVQGLGFYVCSYE